MKDRTLRERVARFIRRRRDAGFKPDKIAMELGRGALAIMRIDNDNEEGAPAAQLIFTKTERDGVSMEARTADADHSIALLIQAFGEMPVKGGDAFYVKIDDDRNCFTTEAVNGVSPEMTRAALESAARQFRFYAAQHEAKGTPESDEKAAVNREMQLLMERALGTEVYAPGKMGFLPIDDSEGGFDVAVESLVERGYEHGVLHDDMMRSLMHSVFNIGQCHGWTEETRILIHRGSDGNLGFESVAPTTPRGREVVILPPETPRERDSGVQTTRNSPMDAEEAVEALRDVAERLDQLHLQNIAGDVRDHVNAIEACHMRGTPPLHAWLSAKARVAAKAGMTDTARVLDQIVTDMAQGLVDDLPVDPESALRQFYKDCHARNVKAGWWNDLATGTPKKRSVGELFVLIVTELAEAYEAYLSGDTDDKLPHLPGLGVELGDVQIRLADFCGALLEGSIVEDSGASNPGDEMFRQIVTIARRYEAIRKTDAAKGEPEEGEAIPAQDVAGMTFEKLAFNATRPDHKIENRMKDDGKRT